MEIPTLAIARREMEIIGVSKNAHYGDLKDDTPPVVYIPYNQGTEPPLNEAREAIEFSLILMSLFLYGVLTQA
jgi:hypothetical protein